MLTQTHHSDLYTYVASSQDLFDFVEEQRMEKGIIWILLCTLISNSAYALIAPFLPLEFKEKGISAELVGLIFAIYSVAVIICSPLVATCIAKVGNSNIISGGVVMMGLCFILFGIMESMSSPMLIMVYALCLRFVQGASSAFVQTTCYSIATNDFPEKKEAIVGWVEAMTGIGLIIGPIVGSVLYAFLGFAKTFYVYGTFLVFLGGVIKCLFPDTGKRTAKRTQIEEALMPPSEEVVFTGGLQYSDADNNEQINIDDVDSVEPIGICTLIGNARFTMAALSSALCYFTYSFMEPILA